MKEELFRKLKELFKNDKNRLKRVIYIENNKDNNEEDLIFKLSKISSSKKLNEIIEWYSLPNIVTDNNSSKIKKLLSEDYKDQIKELIKEEFDNKVKDIIRDTIWENNKQWREKIKEDNNNDDASYETVKSLIYHIVDDYNDRKIQGDINRGTAKKNYCGKKHILFELLDNLSKDQLMRFCIINQFRETTDINLPYHNDTYDLTINYIYNGSDSKW
jgi:hypothetical protein